MNVNNRKFIRIISSGIAALCLLAAGFLSSPAFARERAEGEFKLAQPVRWEDSILPSGDYAYSVDSENTPAVVRVRQKHGHFSGVFLSKGFVKGGYTGPSQMIFERVGEDMFVMTLRVKDIGAEMNFSVGKVGASASATGAAHLQNTTASGPIGVGFISIVNASHENVPFPEVEKVYSSACETVEREFRRPEPIHPRLKLLIGTSDNLVRYETREILLKNWNAYLFAEAVVALAINDLGSLEERVKLSKLAVSQAQATVNLCELKKCAHQGELDAAVGFRTEK